MGEVIFLDVPYGEKDEAKALGAKWNPKERKWYIPQGVGSGPFARWLPHVDENQERGLRIYEPIYVVESSTPCWSCGGDTPVIALAVDHLDGFDEEEEEENCLILLSGIEEMPEDLAKLLGQRYPFLKRRFSKTAGQRYFMNHCSCGAPLGDFFLHSEPGGAFFPTTVEEGAQIILRELPFSGPLWVQASPGQAYPDLIGTYARRERF